MRLVRWRKTSTGWKRVTWKKFRNMHLKDPRRSNPIAIVSGFGLPRRRNGRLRNLIERLKRNFR